MATQDININYANATPPQKNLSMLGRCYDLKTMDPLNLSGSALIDTFVKYKFNEYYHPVSDNSMTIPDGVLYKPGTGGNFSSITKIADSYDSFMKEISGSVKFGVGVPGVGSFSASVSANYYKKEEARNRTEVTYTKLVAYDDTLKIGHMPLMDNKGRIVNKSGFTPDLNLNIKDKLMSIKNETMAEEFIEEYGSHYTSQVGFGGIAYQWVFMTKKERQTLETFGVDIKMEAEGVLKGISLSGGIEESFKFAKEFRKVTLCDRQFVNFIGGLPNENLYSWASTVPSEPTAISVVLMPMSIILEDRNCIQRKSIESVLKFRTMESSNFNYINLTKSS